MGGTFDNFHSGHALLISTACNLAKDAFIGVISDQFGKTLFEGKLFNDKIQKLDVRIKSVNDFLLENKFIATVGILDNPYGPSITDKKADLIVVSYETRRTADSINVIRINNGLNILDIVTIPWEYDGNGEVISSSRIRTKRYSNHGE
ncbi:MAG: Phosphopantetheine adenylyltransferase [Candidatus Heimdallarchaeota archaeon LC_2]|nr:MAG: Phosphopantetheine adenylyltransferase [Candidatus Heimdallarchaeota archaeon LC_2]